MKIEMLITLDQATGQMQVSGPIENKGLAYMMLELARDLVRDHADATAKASHGLAVVRGSLPPANGNGTKASG